MSKKRSMQDDIDDQNKQRATEKAMVIKQVKSLMANPSKCQFSLFKSKGNGNYPCICAIKMTPKSVVDKKGESESIYFSDTATFGIKKKSEWITAEKLSADKTDDMYVVMEHFITMIPITIWMEFMVCLAECTYRLLPIDRPTEDTSYDTLYRTGKWISINPCFFGASFNVVYDNKETFSLAIMVHNSQYVYMPIQKEKARVLIQCVHQKVRESYVYFVEQTKEAKEESGRKEAEKQVDLFATMKEELSRLLVVFEKIEG